MIATPIGNLGDITFRAVETLKKLDILFCEDTRVTMKLLQRFELKSPLESSREEVHQRQAARVIQCLKEDKTVGFVSDAGTPGISDPGARLVAEVLKHLPDVKVEPIPGVTAVGALLSISGLYSDQFLFLGFPPHKKGRQTFVREALESERTTVLYESTHRIDKLLEEIINVEPTRHLVMGRELTKLHETVYRGTALEVKEMLSKTSEKGEFVIALAGAAKNRTKASEAERDSETDGIDADASDTETADTDFDRDDENETDAA